MSAQPFTRDDWRTVAKELQGVAAGWWTEHEDTLVDLGRDEMSDLAKALRSGDLTQAKLELVSRMSQDEWVAYRDGTTAILRDIARRRAALLDALGELGQRAAKLVGKVLATILGLPSA